jgi:hypothetical protein
VPPRYDRAIADVLASRPDVDLLVDLVSFSEPYFITAGTHHGTIVSAVPGADGPGIPRIGISAEPDDLAALAQLAERLEDARVNRGPGYSSTSPAMHVTVPPATQIAPSPSREM